MTTTLPALRFAPRPDTPNQPGVVCEMACADFKSLCFNSIGEGMSAFLTAPECPTTQAPACVYMAVSTSATCTAYPRPAKAVRQCTAATTGETQYLRRSPAAPQCFLLNNALPLCHSCPSTLCMTMTIICYQPLPPAWASPAQAPTRPQVTRCQQIRLVRLATVLPGRKPDPMFCSLCRCRRARRRHRLRRGDELCVHGSDRSRR